MSKNKLTREGGRISKNFGSHLNFLREQTIFAKLKGTGLTPELIEYNEGTIDREFVEGPSLRDEILACGEDLARLKKLFSMFLDWYDAYWKIIKFTLGNPRLEKFIINEGKLRCIDFEQSRPGRMEDDFNVVALELEGISPDLSKIFREMVSERYKQEEAPESEGVPAATEGDGKL